MKNTCLLIFTDGRVGYLDRTLESFEKNLKWEFDHVIMTNDSGDVDHALRLTHSFKSFNGVPIVHRFNGGRLGFARTIASTWRSLPDEVGWIFHLEDDFTLNQELDLNHMIEIMELNPHLVQMALMRQPWNEDEKRCGGIWQWHSSRGVDFQQKKMLTFARKPEFWYEHMGWFTTNPCLYPRWVADGGWPTDEGAGEGKLMRCLLADDMRRRAAYWGSMSDTPIVEHIGHGRKGFGY